LLEQAVGRGKRILVTGDRAAVRAQADDFTACPESILADGADRQRLRINRQRPQPALLAVVGHDDCTVPGAGTAAVAHVHIVELATREMSRASAIEPKCLEAGGTG
jgi:hypothetical protein